MCDIGVYGVVTVKLLSIFFSVCKATGVCGALVFSPLQASIAAIMPKCLKLEYLCVTFADIFRLKNFPCLHHLTL